MDRWNRSWNSIVAGHDAWPPCDIDSTTPVPGIRRRVSFPYDRSTVNEKCGARCTQPALNRIPPREIDDSNLPLASMRIRLFILDIDNMRIACITFGMKVMLARSLENFFIVFQCVFKMLYKTAALLSKMRIVCCQSCQRTLIRFQRAVKVIL